MIKKMLLIVGVMTAILAAGCGEVNIGYVDGEKLMETPQIKTIREEGEKKLQEAETAVQTELDSKANASDEEKQKAQIEAQRKLVGIQQAYATQMKQKIDAAISGIVKNKNIDVVIENSEETKIVIEGGIDLTDEIVQKLQ